MPAFNEPQVYSGDTRDYGHACVGFDFGTTGGRACFLSNGPPENISSSDPVNDPFRSDSDVNFEASVNPFTSGHDEHTTIREEVESLPLKFAVYIAYILELRRPKDKDDSGYEAETRNDIPQVDSFFTRYDLLQFEEKERVIQRLNRAFIDFLLRVKKQCELKAESQRCKISQLIATIPSAWTKWMQAYYAARLKSVWHLSYDDIVTIYESEAIANFLLKRDQRLLRSVHQHPKIWCLIDLGGHTVNINTYYFKIHPSTMYQFAVYGMDNDICIHGGMELHAALVQKRILHDIESGILNVPKHQEKAVYTGLIDYYRTKFRTKVDGSKFQLMASPENDVAVWVTFEEDEAQEMYKRCFSNALKAVSRHLEQVSREQMSSETEVVLTGGSFRNTHLVEEVKKEIYRKGFRLRNDKQSTVDAKEAGRVAGGAGFALQSTITVEKFMSRACFAVQTSKKGQTPDAVIWQSGSARRARVLLPGTQGATRFVTCCPVAEKNDATVIDAQSTYKVIDLPQLPRGEYDIDMEYHKSTSETECDIVKIYCTKVSGRAYQRGEPRRSFPIYYDCGPRACFEDVDKRPKEVNTRPEYVDIRPSGRGYGRQVKRKPGERGTQTLVGDDVPMPELQATLDARLKKEMLAWDNEDGQMAMMETHQPLQLRINLDAEAVAMPMTSKAREVGHRRKRQASSSLPVPVSYREGKQSKAGVASKSRPDIGGPSSSSAPGPAKDARRNAGSVVQRAKDTDIAEEHTRETECQHESYQRYIRLSMKL